MWGNSYVNKTYWKGVVRMTEIQIIMLIWGFGILLAIPILELKERG